MVLCSFSAARLNDFWWKHRCWCQNGSWLTPLSPATDKLDLLLVALLIWWSWAMFMWWHMAGSEMSAAGFSTSFRLGGNSSNPQTHMAAGPQHFWKWYSFTRADSSNGARIGFRKRKKKLKKGILCCYVMWNCWARINVYSSSVWKKLQQFIFRYIWTHPRWPWAAFFMTLSGDEEQHLGGEKDS